MTPRSPFLRASLALVLLGCSAASDGPDSLQSSQSPSNSCTGVTCNSPPANTCDGERLRMYVANGTCDKGACRYATSEVDCPNGCSNGSCNSDPCLGVTCNAPPPNACTSADMLLVYDVPGTCDAGNCIYGTHEESCGFGCANNACNGDPCAGVSCNTPPASFCSDADTLTYHDANGTCDGGSCSYTSHEQDCEFGCEAGACNGDPCAGVNCNTPNANYCADEGTLHEFESTGTCDGGACTYDASDVDCPHGCASGVCRECTTDPDCGAARFCDEGMCADCTTPDHCGDSCVDCSAGGQTCSAGVCADCAVDADCAASGMWCDAGSCLTCDTADHCGDSCTTCSGSTPDCNAGSCACNSTSCDTNQHCVAGSCALCVSDDSCGPDCSPCGTLHCLDEGTASQCVPCTLDAHCNTAAGEVCHPTQHVCTLDTCVGTLYASDFEADNGGLVADGESWAWGAVSSGPGSCDSGAACWSTNPTGDYDACEHGTLTSPPLDLSQCAGKVLTLTFRAWYEYEEYSGSLYDGFLLEYFDGTSWIQPSPEGGWDDEIKIYNCSGVYIANKEGFGGYSGGWVTKTFVLPMLSGIPAFQFRLVHGTDSTSHWPGAYVDDVQLLAP